MQIINVRHEAKSARFEKNRLRAVGKWADMMF